MHEIKLYDQVGGSGITAAEFTDGIPLDATEITVRINSLGGSVADGLAIYNYLRDHKAHVTTIVDGYAASIASVIMLAGDTRLAHRSSIVMIHNPWTMAAGTAEDMRRTANALDEAGQAIVDIYKDVTGMEGDELEALMKEETYMRGEAAVSFGFASAVSEDVDEPQDQLAACAQFAGMFAALTEGRELMSKQKTRKDLEAELVAKADEIKQVEATVAEVEADAVAKVDEAEVATVAAVAERDAIAARLDTAEASIVAMQEAVSAIKLERDEAEARADDKALEARKAITALSNPAVADAVLTDAKPQAAVVSDAEADASEAAAVAVEGEAPKNELEAWEAMDAGDERSTFWAVNKKTILEQLSKR